MRSLISIILLLALQSCSLAPFSSNKSARSLGPGNAQFELGSANSSYYLKLAYGASPDLDVGYVMEFGGFGTSGLFMKYSLVNQQLGPSHALELGYGGSDTSTYYYAGLISSLAFNEYFELFINPRLVRATTDEKDVDLGKTVGNVTVNDEDLTYLYLSTGMNIWISKSFGISIYSLYLKGDDIETKDDFTTAATAMFRF
jgi:hypothetical protein